MSVITSQGYDVEKPTSKVLAPPGGKSSGNILGGYEEPEEKKPAVKQQSAPISNVFGAGAGGDDDAQQQANKNKAKAQESSQHRLFGGNDDESKPAGKGRGQYHPGSNVKGEDWATYDHSDEEEDKEKEKPKAKSADEQNKGNYNPITNQDYTDSPKPAEQAQKPKRQPPGGFSAGIW